jgi:hypothetical protein
MRLSLLRATSMSSTARAKAESFCFGSVGMIEAGQKAVQCVEHVAPRWLNVAVSLYQLVPARR